MVEISTLWLPILLSAVFVFFASFIIHMVLPFHKGDYKKVPDESKVMDTIRPLNIEPGDYMMPCASSSKDMKSPEFAEKMKKGPVMHFTVLPSGPFSMGPSLAQWFVYCLIIGIFSAYVAGRALTVGVPYLQVFRFAGVTAFLGYGAALWQNSIWYKRSWGTTFRLTIDSLVYALLTAGTFGWLWPR
jgi:hypothetical protein